MEGPAPVQRLLTLIAILVESREPVTFASLQAATDGAYGEPVADPDDPAARKAFESARRKFERDKALLAELGLPLRWVEADGGDADEAGYRLDPSDLRMPEVHLDASDLAALRTAALLAEGIDEFPLRYDLRTALAKIGTACAGVAAGPGEDELATALRFRHGPVVGGRPMAPILAALAEAVVERRPVALRYRASSGEETARTVEPYGLFLRRGVWSLVGHCRLRGDVRVFDVHRVLRAEPAGKAESVVVPPAFRLRDYSDREPWELGFHAPVDVRLHLDRAVTGLTRSVLAHARVLETADDGALTVEVRATHLDPLLGLVLSLWGRARVLGPDDAVERFAGLLDGLVAAHDDAVTAGGEAGR